MRFKWSLQALAAPPEVQLQLFPDYSWKVDEIAIEFDQWYQVMKRRRSFFSKRQRTLLENLNRKLDEISGPENLKYWLEDALRTDAVWDAIRSLARIVLAALGWPLSESLDNRSETLSNIQY